MITDTGYNKFCIWEHSKSIKDLYARRCRKEVEEMISHRQAVGLIKPFCQEGNRVLDVGCGSGYLYHSFKNQHLDIEYLGIDAASSLINIGRGIMPQFGLPADSLQVMRIEDMDGEFDHVLSINVLSNIDNYYRPLERMLKMARKTVVLRESLSDHSQYLYVKDKYLDEGVDLKVHVNTYDTKEVIKFINSYGFQAEDIIDEYTGGKPENVIDYPHYWKFILARKSM